MGCEPFIFTANDDVAEVATGGYFPLGEAVHWQCKDCELNGSAIVCHGRGAFEATAVVTVSQIDASGSTPPLLGATIVQNGLAAQGGSAEQSSSGTAVLTMHCIVRNDTRSSSTVAVRNTGPAVRAGSVSLTVRPIR